MSKIIPNTNGRYSITNDGIITDILKNRVVSSYIRKDGYIGTVISYDKIRKHKLIHRLIAETFIEDYTTDKHVDHRDSNKLNNNIDNLRMATITENNRNAMKKRNTISIFKGVTYHAKSEKWRSRIKVDNKDKSLGLYFSEEAAASAYNDAAIRLFGEFAKLNDFLPFSE